MSLSELFYSCKTGDIQKLRSLVEEKEVDINVRDKWDSTPLYYACLCGHRQIVQYLLEHGAKCEANTFDGERCVYGALTDDIRNLLRSYKAISNRLMRRDGFDEFLRKLLDSGEHADVEFLVHGEKFLAHRCILSVRCPFFGELFRTKWQGRRSIELKHTLMVPWAFQSILQYLYTGRLETHMDFVDDCLRLARQCQLPTLEALIESSMKKTLDFQASKSGVIVTTLVVEEPANSYLLQTELGQLTNAASPPAFCSWVQGELPFDQQDLQTFTDISFVVDGHQFLCHKAFFCERSDYFKALIQDHFGEASSSSSDSVPIITLRDVGAHVFHRVLTYIYQDSCDLTEDTAYDVLCTADMYLLPGLKRLCGAAMIALTTLDNVVWMVRIARLFSLPRLEASCAEFIANNIFEVVEQQEFADLVTEDASQVKGRQETDSIDIIDEVRFYVANMVHSMSEVTDAEDRLRLIDQLLEDLELDG
ncbi:ankyrin repeat and BTB/POZ domain-containing protein 1-like [Babylonia areolata]|uniref:ankyrin repeat and BTB/POZ domain-containing protein 1-like n=1 Tax=Babylonia areolata TaxID=304850 RepID=UPI003FD18BEE